MPPAEQDRMNALLADPDQVNVAGLLADGRIGLYVVSQLARRHGIQVRLQTNIYGGVQAVLVVPQGLIGSAQGTAADITTTLPQPTEPDTRTVTGPLVIPAAAAPRGTAPGGSRTRVPPPRGTRAVAPPRGRTGPGEPRQPRHDLNTPGSGRSPLPVRDGDTPRPNPAEAAPGIRPGDRAAAEQNAGRPPTPLTGTVRGTMGKPRLPHRRAQEHIAPQLRGGPAPSVRQDHGRYVSHDPGLMAAFQRGIGLAETHRQPDPDRSEPGAHDWSEPGAKDRSEPGVYDPSEPEVYDRSESGVFDGVESDAHVRPESGVFDGAEADVHDRSEPGAYDRPESGVYDRSESGGYDGPEADVYDRVEPGRYDGPDPDVYDRSEHRAYDRVEPGAYDRSEPDAHDRSESGGYDRSVPDAHDRVEPDAYDRVEPGGYAGPGRPVGPGAPLAALHLDTALPGGLSAAFRDPPPGDPEHTAEGAGPHMPDHDLTVRHDGSGPPV
jgi:hypothetical protein